MLKPTYDVVYWDEDGKKELINTFDTMEEAEKCLFRCYEGDKNAQVNQSYDIEQGYMGVPGH